MGNRLTKKETQEFYESIPARVFLCYRRVCGDLFHEYGLTGYQIDMLVFVIGLSGYTVGNVVTGSQIFKKATKRFRNVARPIANTLVERGFLEYLYTEGEKKHRYKVGMTERGYEFAHSWRLCLNKHLESDGAELVLNAKFSWEKKKA